MNMMSSSEFDLPSVELAGDPASGVPRWAQLVTLLWALSRARTGRRETARFRDVETELQDSFAEFCEGVITPENIDTAATWLSMGCSNWWSTDLRPGATIEPSYVREYNSTGGLSPTAVSLAVDDEACAEVVHDVVSALPYSDGLVRLLELFLFDEFVEFVDHGDPPTQLSWPGILDSEQAAGSHELADAASEGNWDEVITIIDRERANGRDLVNTWRPGGSSWSTVLHQAARQGAALETIDALLERGAWRTMSDARGQIPLDWAVRAGHIELIEALCPPEFSSAERAVHRALEIQAAEAIDTICRESGLRRTPRFRAPIPAVLAEIGAPLSLDVAGVPLLHFWIDSDELCVAYWWDSSGVDGSVYVFGPEGERRESPWDGTFHRQESEEGQATDESSQDQWSDEHHESDPPDDHLEEPDPDESPSTLTYSGHRILVGTSRRFGPFYVLAPRSKLAEVLRRPEAHAKAIGILVDRTEGSRKWAVLGRNWRHRISAFDSIDDAQWTDFILFRALFRRNGLNDRLVAMAEFWAATGIDPLDEPEFSVAMREGLGESDVVAIEARWHQFVASMTNHGLDPTGAIRADGLTGRVETTAEMAEAALDAVNAPSKKGRRREFDNAIPMSLQTTALRAEGRWNGQTMLVVTGSRAALDDQPKIPPASARVRRQLISAKKLVRDGDSWVFAKDHRFESPSAAASAICGSSQNGREMWEDATGRTINDIEGGVKYVKAK